jgi:hypothetical protein
VLSKFDYVYDAPGHVTSWVRQAGAGAPTAYHLEYDPADQLIVATLQTTDATPTVLKRFEYGYDSVGNRTAEQEDDGLVGAVFNNRNELVSMQPSGALRLRGTTNEPAREPNT